MIETDELRTYQQWIKCLEYLSTKTVSDEFIENLKNKVCPGIKNVMPQFLERVQATVNKMINKSTKNCTTLLNEALEEGDFSNIESYLYLSLIHI